MLCMDTLLSGNEPGSTSGAAQTASNAGDFDTSCDSPLCSGEHHPVDLTALDGLALDFPPLNCDGQQASASAHAFDDDRQQQGFSYDGSIIINDGYGCSPSASSASISVVVNAVYDGPNFASPGGVSDSSTAAVVGHGSASPDRKSDGDESTAATAHNGQSQSSSAGGAATPWEEGGEKPVKRSPPIAAADALVMDIDGSGKQEEENDDDDGEEGDEEAAGKEDANSSSPSGGDSAHLNAAAGANGANDGRGSLAGKNEEKPPAEEEVAKEDAGEKTDNATSSTTTPSSALSSTSSGEIESSRHPSQRSEMQRGESVAGGGINQPASSSTTTTTCPSPLAPSSPPCLLELKSKSYVSSSPFSANAAANWDQNRRDAFAFASACAKEEAPAESGSSVSRMIQGLNPVFPPDRRELQAGHWFRCALCHSAQETHRLFQHAREAHNLTDPATAASQCMSPLQQQQHFLQQQQHIFAVKSEPQRHSRASCARVATATPTPFRPRAPLQSSFPSPTVRFQHPSSQQHNHPSRHQPFDWNVVGFPHPQRPAPQSSSSSSSSFPRSPPLGPSSSSSGDGIAGCNEMTAVGYEASHHHHLPALHHHHHHQREVHPHQHGHHHPQGAAAVVALGFDSPDLSDVVDEKFIDSLMRSMPPPAQAAPQPTTPVVQTQPIHHVLQPTSG